MESYDCGISYYIAEMIFFIFKIGEAMLEPSVRLFIYQGVCQRESALFPNHSIVCNQAEIHSEDEHLIQTVASKYIMSYKVLINAPAILLGLFCGAWSDRIGRKLPVMLTSFGTIVAVLFYMCSMLTDDVGPFLPLVLVGATVRGAFGKSAIMTMALHSYVSDITTKEQRTEKIARLLAMNYFGYFIGSLIAGALLDVSSFNVVFCSVVFVNCLCVIITVLFMKESVPGVKSIVPSDSTSSTLSTAALVAEEGEGEEGSNVPKKKPSKKHPFTLANIRASLTVLYEKRDGGARCHLIFLFSVIIIQQACKSGEVDITLLFVERTPLLWRRSMYGYLLALDYAFLGIAVLFLLPPLVSYLHVQDMTLTIIGVGFKVLRLLLIAFADKAWIIFLSVVVSCPSAFIISGAKSLISKTVREDEMGKAFSLLSCGETLANLIGSVAFTSIYSATQNMFAGFTFCVDSVLFVLMFISLLLLGHDMKMAERYRLLHGLKSAETSRELSETTPQNNEGGTADYGTMHDEAVKTDN